MNKFFTNSFLSILFCASIAPIAVAEMTEDSTEPTDNRIEKYEQLTETETNSLSETEAMESQTEAIESAEDAEEANTRAEQKLEEYQANTVSPTGSYDVRRTEAFNLVSSAYRGQFEDQGINSYAVLVSNYSTGELTAEDLINAAIQAGELSPNAMQDESYIRAVESQLEALVNS